MSEEKILFELTAKYFFGPWGISSLLYKKVIHITEKGINYFTKGAVSAIAKKNIFIPIDQIKYVRIVLHMLNMEHDLIIGLTSGKELKLQQVDIDQARKAKKIIFEIRDKADAEELLKLSKLKEAGILSSDEFETQKKKILYS